MGTIGYGYGSEWHLTLYLARRREAFTRLVAERLGVAGISWLDHDELVDRRSGNPTLGEPRGLSFLPVEHPVRREWEQLWPQTGNVHNWDAVGRAVGEPGAWVLLEAKAHVGELASSCGATSEASRQRISDILRRAREQLGVPELSDWMNGYYQYCNRLALLHFLRERGVDAHLIFAYFTGDRADLGSSGRLCPESEDSWRSALEVQKRHVGVPASSALLRFVHQVFLPAYLVPVREPAGRTSVTHP